MPPASNVIDLPTRPSTTSSRRVRRLVAQDDQARLVAAAAADGGQRAHPELVELARGRAPRTSGARARRASSCACSPSVCGVSSFGGMLARSRARFARSATMRGALAASRSSGVVGVADDDPLERARPRRLDFQRAGRVGAEDRALDERRGLLAAAVRAATRRAARRGFRRRGREPGAASLPRCGARRRRRPRACRPPRRRGAAPRARRSGGAEPPRRARRAARRSHRACRGGPRACRPRCARRHRRAAALPEVLLRPRLPVQAARSPPSSSVRDGIGAALAAAHKLALDPEKER